MKKYLVIYAKTKTEYSAYPPNLQGVVATCPTKTIVEKNLYEAIRPLEITSQKPPPVSQNTFQSQNTL